MQPAANKGVWFSPVNTTSFNNTFDNPDSAMTGLIVAIYEIGCFLGAIATAFVGECLGRRKSIGLGCVIMIVGAILQASSFGRAQMIVARVVSGFGMGIINSTVPVVQAEFSPKSSRGICKCPGGFVETRRRRRQHDVVSIERLCCVGAG